MSRVAVVTDTTAYLPGDVVRAHQIHLVSLYVNFGGERTVREADITDYERFYAELRDSESLPTTSQPAVGDFLAVYEPLLEQGLDVLSIHISAGLSGTCDAARQAVETLERSGQAGRVRVLDSATGAGGIGLLALGAAKAAREGGDLDAVEKAAREVRAALKIWFAIDTLEYLRRGGRIGGARAWIGSTLKIKPILTVESEMTPVERVRTSARMFDRMVEFARERHADGADGWVVQHIQSPDQANKLADACREIYGSEPVWISEVGPVLGVHTGPGLLGVGGVPRGMVE
ncbi:MAG TPA: DegV family protein [Thermoleophilaceae bacterium]|nr:DegV family protein [Thermoleophilaceae bacterium]